jgi:hypothetical protein
MTTKELIKHLKSCGFIVSEDEDMIHAKKGKQTVNCDKTIQPDSLWTYVLSLLTEYNQTPLDERVDEPKYRVPLRGFYSGNGCQYLTADGEDIKIARFFACARNYSLKQEFTMDELNTIANRLQFKGIDWFQDLIRHAEPVEED